ncbi:winged helix-turn-helix transcriptional regulator [Candidatus Uhrbacteria bacterium]|nr:winged helix-turn-helix transcriptional regulator [Candidatus Uhrbacteria bacterium]
MNLSFTEQKEITEVLTSFGFNPKDQEVYLGLLAQGKTSLTPLSRRLRLPVSTVQSSMNRLVERGVVEVTKQKTRSLFEASDPDVFRMILKEQANGVAGILPLLEKLKTDSPLTPKLRVFQRERVTELFNMSLACKNKIVYEIVSAKDFQEIIGEKYHYSRRRVKAGVKLKSLRIREHEIKKYNRAVHGRELREARFLPPELTFRTSISFWDDTVAFFTTTGEGIHWAVESRTLRETYQQLFELLWSISATMETLVESKLDKVQ